MIKEFVDLLDRMKIIHEKKNRDYAGEGQPFENFQRSAHVAEWFNDPVDKVFVTLITTKLARLSTLLNSGNNPNNESIDDSFLDLTTYCGLWTSWQHSIHNYKVPVEARPKGEFIPFCQCKYCGCTFTREPRTVEVFDSTGKRIDTYPFCSVIHKDQFIRDLNKNGWIYVLSSNSLHAMNN